MEFRPQTNKIIGNFEDGKEIGKARIINVYSPQKFWQKTSDFVVFTDDNTSGYHLITATFMFGEITG